MTQNLAYERDGAAIYRQSFAISGRGRPERGPGRPGARGRPDDPRLRDDRPAGRPGLVAGGGQRGARRPGPRRGRAMRHRHGRRRDDPVAAAGRQPGRVHPGRPAGGGAGPALGTTRSAAAVQLWAEHLDGAVVAVGNAPTALYALLELIGAGGPRPAAVLGCRSASSARPSPRRPWPPADCRTWSCAAAGAARPWRPPRSTRWPGRRSDRPGDCAGPGPGARDDGAADRRGRRPGRPGPAHRAGHPADRRRRRHRLPLRPAREQHRPRGRAALPARRAGRGDPAVPGHHRGQRAGLP